MPDEVCLHTSPLEEIALETLLNTVVLVQEEGLRAVVAKRLWRLVRQAARVWADRVQRARAARAAEERLLNALKRVNVGMHARLAGPFRSPSAAALPEVLLAPSLAPGSLLGSRSMLLSLWRCGPLCHL